ncbi:MAG: M23 family metallopeptidase [Proteobacteria bacterium]|nr:M23 family metallopeptidase [Pseudomonadota bacterium]
MMLTSFKRLAQVKTRPITFGERFGLDSAGQVARDLAEVVRDGVRGKRFQFNLGSLALLRPELALPAYVGLFPGDGMAPIFNLFDRNGGGLRYTQRVSRSSCRDFRGGALTYDEHDGTDLVCPVGTPLCAAAPGVVVMIRHRWLRGGLTVAVDHGGGVLTQYSHCSRAVTELGEPVERGQPVALSGASGYDLVQFFPWLAPHIHFMVYLAGRPVDPFLAPGEVARPGSWYHGNAPQPSGPLPGDPARLSPSPVSAEMLERVAQACRDPAIRAEIDRVADNRPALAALVEDALGHDSWAFPARLHRVSVRPDNPPDPVAMTLPLPISAYCGVRLADTRWSAPAR